MTDGCQAYYFSYLIFRQFLVYIIALIVLDELKHVYDGIYKDVLDKFSG